MASVNPQVRIKKSLVEEAQNRGHSVNSLLEYLLTIERTQLQSLSFQVAKLTSILSGKLPSEEDLEFLRNMQKALESTE